MIHALIDADVIAYRCAASCEPTKTTGKEWLEPVNVALLRVEDMMTRILTNTATRQFSTFLSGSDNFRYHVDPEYKANRKKLTRPTHLEDCREHLITRWKGTICNGYEADDAIGMAHNDNTICCSVDKDLLQLPGRHYNPVKDQFLNQSPEDAAKVIWYLMLVGDTSDNVRGVDRIGPVKANRIIAGADSIEDLAEYVRELYNDNERYEQNLHLLRVLRNERDHENVKAYIENKQRQGQREAIAAISEGQDPYPFSDAD